MMRLLATFQKSHLSARQDVECVCVLTSGLNPNSASDKRRNLLPVTQPPLRLYDYCKE